MSRKNNARHLPTPEPTKIPRKEPQAARYVKQPRVFCTLNPETWELSIELPGPAGRRLVALESIETLREILVQQMSKIEAMGPSRIGDRDEPTEAQVKHWEEHSRRNEHAKLHSNCPFCIAEANHPIHKYDSRGKPIIPGVGNPELLGI